MIPKSVLSILALGHYMSGILMTRESGFFDLFILNEIYSIFFRSLTCIRFRYFDSDDSLRGKDYLQYFRGTGCWSQVGKTGGRQPVSIGYGCEAVRIFGKFCSKFVGLQLSIVAHETLHALGLWHEQSRTDRDGFIRINLDAIMPVTLKEVKL